MKVTTRFPSILMFCVLLGISACSVIPFNSSPTKTPISTDTLIPFTITPHPPTETPLPPTLTPLPTGTLTPSPQPTHQVRTDVYLYDPFEDDSYGWYTGDYQDDFVISSRTIQDGAFRWNATALQPSRLTGVPGMDVLENFSLSVETTRLSGPEDSGSAILFRRQDRSNAYFFIVRETGQYAFMRLLNDQWTALIDYTPSEAIRPGQMNEIMVTAQGSHFDFFINGENINSAEDTTFPTGIAGLGVFLAETGDEVSYEFDNFEIDASEIPPTQSAIDCSNGAPAGNWLLVVNSASQQQITIDGVEYTVYPGRNEFYLNASDIHTVTAGGNTTAFVSRECGENTLNIR